MKIIDEREMKKTKQNKKTNKQIQKRTRGTDATESLLNRVLGVLACSRAWRAYVLVCSRAWRVYVLTIVACFRAYVLGVLDVLMCLVCLRV